MPLTALALLVTSAAVPAQDAVDVSAPAVVECAAAAPAFIMPTTGVPFTLPPDDTAEPCMPVPPPPVRPPAPDLFRMVALPVGADGPAQKWAGARFDSVAEHAGPWRELLSEARRLSADPVPMVNQWVNWHIRYREDVGGDEWATASATLRRGFGDCEDFAVAKMALLADLGVSPDDMYLVLLRDQRQSDHAVLAVKRNGRLFVLDNRTDKVLPADAIADYTPVLSFSGPFAWTYGERRLSTR